MPAIPPTDCCAALTAGGQSRRFGRDKALAYWQGRTLLEHAALGFAPSAERLLIAPAGKYHLPGWRTVPDLHPGEGPLAGLETALSYAPAGWVAFAGVDMPRLDSLYWQALWQARTPKALAVIAMHEARPQPLGALYHTDLLPRVRALLLSGERRLRLAAPPERTVLVNGLSAAYFSNVNTPDQLTAL